MNTKKIITALSIAALGFMPLMAGAQTVPVVTAISPLSASAGADGAAVTVFGTGFTPNSVVSFNGIAHATTYVSSTQLQASLTPSEVSTPLNYMVLVSTPGAGASNAMFFRVSGTTTVVPGLPNTGFAPEQGIPAAVWGTGLAVMALAALAFALARRAIVTK